MTLRTFFTSECMEPQRDLDAYGWSVLKGNLPEVKDDFERRIASHGDKTSEEARKAAVDEVYALRWGPTRVPIYNLLLLATILVTGRRQQILEVARWMATEVKIPVDGRDLSGSTAMHHAISTKPSFDPEFAQILYDAGADVNARNRYGETAVFDAGKIFNPKDFGSTKKASSAIEWFLKHGGNLDLKENDGWSARATLLRSREVFITLGGSVAKEMYAMIDREDKRRQGDVKCCLFCGMEREDTPVMTCSRCKSVRYCRAPRDCQKRDWPNHKQKCKK